MKQVLLLFILSVTVAISYGRGTEGRMLTQADSISAEVLRIKKELRVTDTTFFKAVDSLIHYSVDPKFSTAQQEANQKSIYEFLSRIITAEPIKSGRAKDYVRFAFSIMDWRKDGTLYANLSNYARFALHCASFFRKILPACSL